MLAALVFGVAHARWPLAARPALRAQPFLVTTDDDKPATADDDVSAIDLARHRRLEPAWTFTREFRSHRWRGRWRIEVSGLGRRAPVGASAAAPRRP